MFRHPVDLDAEAQFRRDTIAALRQRAGAPGAAAATQARPLTRVRRGLGHQLIAVGARLAGDAPAALQPKPAAGRAG